MKNILMVVLLFSLLGCDGMPKSETTWSEIKEEEAEVIQLSYVPSITSRGMGIGPTFSKEGGMAVVMTSQTNPEVWAVVFRCKLHNKTFAFDDRKIYEHAKVGDIVKLKYVDELRNNYIYHDKKWMYLNTDVVDQHTKQIIFPNSYIVDRND